MPAVAEATFLMASSAFFDTYTAGISAIGTAVALASAGNRASAASSWQYTAVGHTAPDSLLTNPKVKQLVTDYRQPAIQIVKPLFAK